MNEQLEAHLGSRVSGPADQAVDAGQVLVEEGKALQIHQLVGNGFVTRQSGQHVDRHGTLQGDVHAAVGTRRGVAHVAEVARFARVESRAVRIEFDDRPSGQQLAQVGLDLGLVGGVHHDHVKLLGPTIDDDVVEHVAGGVEDVAVLGPTNGELADVVGGRGVEDTCGGASGELQYAHVSAVEQPRRFADGPVLGRDRGIPQGHQVAREGAHPRLAGPLEVLVVQHARHRLGGGRLENELA